MSWVGNSHTTLTNRKAIFAFNVFRIQLDKAPWLSNGVGICLSVLLLFSAAFPNIARLGCVRCACDQPDISKSAVPNTNTVDIALVKQAKIVTGSEWPKFFAAKLKAPGGDPAESLSVQVWSRWISMMSSPCVRKRQEASTVPLHVPLSGGAGSFDATGHVWQAVGSKRSRSCIFFDIRK